MGVGRSRGGEEREEERREKSKITKENGIRRWGKGRRERGENDIFPVVLSFDKEIAFGKPYNAHKTSTVGGGKKSIFPLVGYGRRIYVRFSCHLLLCATAAAAAVLSHAAAAPRIITG